MSTGFQEHNDHERDDHELDRLVDGELDSQRRQALLSRLEQSPDGWRRCALAFLEAQAWRQDLGNGNGLQPANSIPVQPSVDQSSAKSNRSSLKAWSTPRLVLAAAASFLLAFLLGMAVDRRLWNSPDPAGGTMAEGNGDDIKKPDASTHVAGDGSPRDRDKSTWGLMKFVVDRDGRSEEVQVPVLEHPGINPEHWLQSQPPAVSPRLIEQLRAMGHRVHTNRRLLPVDLQDGREAVVPVDHVEVRFNQGGYYQ